MSDSPTEDNQAESCLLSTLISSLCILVIGVVVFALVYSLGLVAQITDPSTTELTYNIKANLTQGLLGFPTITILIFVVYIVMFIFYHCCKRILRSTCVRDYICE